MLDARRHKRDWISESLIVLGLLLLPLLFWWRLWAPDPADRVPIPPGDFDGQYFPLQQFAASELAEGRWPAWNPYISAGQPGIADVQTGFFYPLNLLPNLILAWLGIEYTLGVLTTQVILHFSLASLFTYLFVRNLVNSGGWRLGASRFAGVVAALSFTYSGYLTSFPVQQITILETAVWLPLVLFFLGRSFRGAGRITQVALAGLALSMAFLAGHPQTAMYVVYAVVAFGLFKSYVPGGGFQGSRLLSLAGVVLLGASLAAIQLLPTLEFISQSTRSGLDYEAVAWGFPLIELTHLFYPGFFGGSPQYVGVMAWILGAASFFVRRARRDVIFWTIVAVFAFLFAFGGHTFLYSVLYLIAPGFGVVRDQERIIYLFAFAMSVLSGYGALVLVQPLQSSVRRGFHWFVKGMSWLGGALVLLTILYYLGYLWGEQQGVDSNLISGLLRHQVLILMVFGGAMLVFWLRVTGKSQRRWIMILTLGLIWFNLFTVNWRYNQLPLGEAQSNYSPVRGPFVETDLVAYLESQPGVFRIASGGLLPGGGGAGSVYRLEDTTGNTPLGLERYRQFREKVSSWRQWQLLNVQFALSSRDIDGPGLERVFEEDGVKIYKIGDPLPRAWVVNHIVVADDEDALALLSAESFHPRTSATVSERDKHLAKPEGPGLESRVQLAESLPGRLSLDVEAGADGLLVVSQPYYPGWQAVIDGHPGSIHRVNYLLQGIPIEAGNHRVDLVYSSSVWPAVVSLVALLGCIAAFFWSRRSVRGNGRSLV
jgi:hypothetical protein